jgi:pilus assembly protein Flp/PilA
VKDLIRSEEGATLVEYGLMVALIALVALLAVTALGVEVSSIFSDGSLLSALT